MKTSMNTMLRLTIRIFLWNLKIMTLAPLRYQVVYQKKELKNPDADCAADFKFKTITKKISIDK